MAVRAGLNSLLIEPAERTLVVGDQFGASLQQLLSRPLGSLGLAPWAILLFPSLAQPDLTLSDSAREVYRRVDWNGYLSPGEIVVRAEPLYLSVVERSQEVGIRTTATTKDGVTASALSVFRLPSDATTSCFGSRLLPQVPVVGATTRGRSLVVDSQSIDQFLDVVGVESPVVASETAAQQAGLPNRLVPSAMLLVAALPSCDDIQGSAEMWFRRPVPVGAALNIGIRIEASAVVGNLTLPGSKEAAVFQYQFGTSVET